MSRWSYFVALIALSLAYSAVLRNGLGEETIQGGQKTPPAALSEDDPLAKALRDLQSDLDRLKDDVRSIRGGTGREEKQAPGKTMEPGAPAMPSAKPTSSPAANKTAAPSPAVTAKPKKSVTSLTATNLGPPAKKSNHWSFQPLRSTAELPAVQDNQWAKDDLDRHILARLEKAGIAPNPDADRYTLLRRVALDLTGLPPTVAQVEAFVKDPASDDQALARAVDHYLRSPRFGERWGRHWLDIARYADSVGRTWNAPFTYAWRYRDYVIDSFNDDKPYNRFIMEQLAGDLLPVQTAAERRDNLIATGFLTLGAMSLNDGRVEGFLMDRVDEQIDVTTRAFLGLTVSCARCHDHKYEPIATTDYYALAGIFYSTDTLSGQGFHGNLGRGGYVDTDLLVRLPDRAGKQTPDSLVPGVHTMSDFQDVARTGAKDIRYATDPYLAMGVRDGEISDCEVRIKGDAYDRGPSMPRGVLQIPGLPKLPPISVDDSGRLELARWIASPDHPLTARVMANRVWQHLMGRGLVRTVDDFGATGDAPTHPELLDHLAGRLVNDGWSIKRLIRAIVLSHAYRLNSMGQGPAKETDAANQWYWRMEPRRLEVEAIRDSLMFAAGRLEFARPEGIQVTGMGGKGKNGIVRSLIAADAPYRAIYHPVLRAFVPELYDTFDFPDPCQLNGQRQVTTVAPQALYFMNGSLVIQCATDMSRQLLDGPAVDDAARVRSAYLKILSRPPTGNEVDAALKLLRDLRPPSDERNPELYRWTTLMQALFASAEFRYAL